MTRVSAAQATWIKAVQKEISTKGAWGPDTRKMKEIQRKDLPPALKKVFDRMESGNPDGNAPDVYTKSVEGRLAFVFSDFFEGLTRFSIFDVTGKEIPMKHKPDKDGVVGLGPNE